ncbi:MAG: OsmC family protein [Chloroflexota bacterium]|nr:OsmC family protein [Chloroflexota bacterium]
MTTTTIRETIDLWEREPDKARSKPMVKARQEGRQAVLEAGPFSWRADLPAVLGGTNEAPSPTALLLSALAGCAVVFIRDTLAPQLGVRVEMVEATVRCETDARGLLGMDGVAPDLQAIQLEIQVRSPDDERDVQQLFQVWQERCPIYLALIKPTNVSLDIRAMPA